MIERISNPNQKYIIWDGESESLNLFSTRFWQLGLLVCEGNKVLEEHLLWIKWPDLKVGIEAARITQFSDKLYKEKATENEKVLDFFESYLYNPEYLVMFFNGLNFDCMVHNSWRRMLGRKSDYSYLDRCIDVHSISKGYKFDIPYRKSDNFLAYQFSMLSQIRKGTKTNLQAMGKEFKIDFNPTIQHEGVQDCLLTNKIWNYGLKPKLENWLLLT